MPRRSFTSGRKFSTTTSARSTRRRNTGGILEVARDAALVAVQVLEVGALARAARRIAGLEARRRLDLDHVGAPVGQLAHAGGAGSNPGQVQHREPFERARSFGKHSGTLVSASYRQAERAGGRTFPDIAGDVHRAWMGLSWRADRRPGRSPP